MTTPPTFEMLTAIHSQPQQASRVTQASRSQIEQLKQAVRKSDRTMFVGIGSSLHAAQLGAALWREVLPIRPIHVQHSFDFVSDPTTRGEINPNTIVVAFSHRGTKMYTLKALSIARELGATTCILTGEERGDAAGLADIHIETVPQERSSAHTVSLIGSIAATTALVEQLAELPEAPLTCQMVASIEAAIAQEASVRRLAATVTPNTRHIWLVGAGTDVVVAREIALKIKETSYIPAEGMSVEEMLHGPFQCVEPNDLFILVDTTGIGTERIATLREMAHVIGAKTMTVSNREGGSPLDASTISVESSTLPAMRAVGALVVLQLLTYWIAVSRGSNPDGFRLEDPRFKEASSLVVL
jgi:glucosamine--fructose-6-phosphate aminotransferase (isomerizing)